ncbi:MULTISPECIES: hypothetical protein [Spiribacter]|jgi:uncharacterized protein YjiS (DUF1127 family)|uniref:DUF1127 domain-containing protein n=2 Tax=Spiribacter TaxID=1335745 RepID=A0A557RHM7_9GAMM|nr:MULTISPECIES: hypothetical protein [Spiribacter]PZA00351.1 hypothetical protein A6K26_002780 [Gammaproteobacteria bacterium 2W06]KAF0280582.1 hypothetical protein BA897_07895 [Spiribacter roseus]KAF0284203.1 hypothetical protein BA898_07575 [Spiribacter roseus]KAF0285422.1 hypothetical protein BA899_00020 [Spiribacter sp. SSL99]TVO64669.1 hypothetical protein FPL11_08455 [Spiribacter aquaticus]
MMFNSNNRHDHSINLREQVEGHNTGIVMPAMPPMRLSRAIGQWLRGRRRHAAADPSRLDNHLKADIGISATGRRPLGEVELTRIYSQPLGQIRLSRQGGAPAEAHALRRRAQDTRH